MTCKGCEGFVEAFFPVVMTFCPPMYMGYSRPSSPATFFSASSIRLRFSGREKSINGSFTNSETIGFVSAVAMLVLLMSGQVSILLRGLRGRQGEPNEAAVSLAANLGGREGGKDYTPHIPYSHSAFMCRVGESNCVLVV